MMGVSRPHAPKVFAIFSSLILFFSFLIFFIFLFFFSWLGLGLGVGGATRAAKGHVWLVGTRAVRGHAWSLINVKTTCGLSVRRGALWE